jgi:hypothetical protein
VTLFCKKEQKKLLHSGERTFFYIAACNFTCHVGFYVRGTVKMQDLISHREYQGYGNAGCHSVVRYICTNVSETCHFVFSLVYTDNIYTEVADSTCLPNVGPSQNILLDNPEDRNVNQNGFGPRIITYTVPWLNNVKQIEIAYINITVWCPIFSRHS